MTVVYDYGRMDRIGLPEVVYSEGKSPVILDALLGDLIMRQAGPVLFTRLDQILFDRLSAEHVAHLDYDAVSRTAWLGGCYPGRDDFRIAIVTAGTSDLVVATEAARTLRFLGFSSTLIADVGVAGLWRLLERLPDINTHDGVIAIAGGDAALATVLGGITPRPIIAVPTSVGYGVAAGGQAALHSMLSSCAVGVPVMNIDNGFGAACAMVRLANVKRGRDGL